MSTGPTLSPEQTDVLVNHLLRSWPNINVVGSLRRGQDARDIDLVAPAVIPGPSGRVHPEDDPLFRLINACVDNPWTPPPRDDAPLFLPEASERPSWWKPWGSALSGLKPGFLAVRLELRTRLGAVVPVQVFRYTPDNCGWVMIERTGPVEFGKWFLWKWRQRHGGLRLSPTESVASVQNHLVDSLGAVVPLRSEREAFEACGVRWVPPMERDDFVARLKPGDGS